MAKSHATLKWIRRLAVVILAYYAVIALVLANLKYLAPATTAVQSQRRIESWFEKPKYRKQYVFVPLTRISPQLQHAVIAAEDGRFYRHHGFDWEEMKVAIQEDLEEGRMRGASTISQQLVKNLFLTTRGSFVRKGLEFTIVPMAEVILGKQRILELYLNVIEWGPGVFGAEAAAQYHYKTNAASLDREQAARLAAILPSPRRRKPARMNEYSEEIQRRMVLLGW